MNVVATVFIALGLAADAFAVSISSGLKIKHIKLNKVLKIALFFGVFQALMPIIGWLLGLSLSSLLSSVDHWVAFSILSCLGGKMIYEALQDKEEIKFNPLNTYTLTGLAIGTSIDALAVGTGFAIINTSIFAIATFIGFITFFVCFIGVFIGHKFGNLFDNKVEIVGGTILILIGSKILFEHLTTLPS